MEDFLNYISQYIQLTDALKNAITTVAKVQKQPKSTQLVEEGKTCKHIYFLADGAIRSFLYQKGKDITHWIYDKNTMFTSWHSYVLTKPSNEYIETISEVEVVAISYEDWQNLHEHHPSLERFSRLMLEEQLALIDDFYKGYYFLTAKEKYDLLLTAFPNITQIANLGHIASMLGISQETLSRIRGK